MEMSTLELTQTIAAIDDLPFATTLSLDLLFDFWKREELEDRHGLADVAKELNRKLGSVPELRGALEPSLFDEHQQLVQSMLTPLLPIALIDNSYVAFASPLSWDFFYSTPRFRHELLDVEGKLKGQLLIDGTDLEFLSRLYAYLLVLRRCYGIGLPFEKSILVQLDNPETGLETCFKLRPRFDFMRIESKGTLPELDPELLESLRDNVASYEDWARLLPPDSFTFYGMMVYEANEVTEEVTRNQLNELLVQPDPLVDIDRFKAIERLIRSFLRMPGLELSLIGIDGDTGFCMDRSDGLRYDITTLDLDAVICSADRSTLSCGRTVIYSDISAIERDTQLLKNCYKLGARSFLMMPLGIDDKLVGALCLSSKEPGFLSGLTKLKLKALVPVFCQALQRTLQDVANRVQAVLKEKFTSIHPAIEWKFKNAALSYVRGQEIGDVLFPDVFSLYSASDIRSSSEVRNRAIQSDLIRQIGAATKVLECARNYRRIEYLEYLVSRLEILASEIESGIRSGDENRVSAILVSEVEPLFDSLEVFGLDVKDSIEAYKGAVCQDCGDLYRERRAYAESVDRLTHTQTELLSHRQEVAQREFPHLFQMYRTDGIEHSIYVGPALTERSDFSPLYVKNLRLWQLETVIEIAKLSRGLKDELAVPLEVAHLILAQNDLISLRFSQEEKKFNVDGAYNTRYEIIKKRIDKSCIKGSEERVTQPNKIAIFYSQPAEGNEYLHFIDYLQKKGSLSPEVEKLEVEDLQGVYGLKALRIAVS